MDQLCDASTLDCFINLYLFLSPYFVPCIVPFYYLIQKVFQLHTKQHLSYIFTPAILHLMHIMLFGGAFDPPHIGHQQIATQILHKHIADELWYVPAKDHPFSKLMTEVKHRIAMLELIQQENTKIKLFEVEKGGKSFSIETLEHFLQHQPEDTFSWLIGSDQLKDFHKWYRYLEMLSLCKVYVYPRSGFAFDPIFPGMVLLKDMQPIDISSTLVRERVKLGEDISKLVDPEVLEYINQHELYNTAHGITARKS